MYQDLLAIERKLDWTMTRKKVEIQESLTRTPTVSRCHRLTRLLICLHRQHVFYVYSSTTQRRHRYGRLAAKRWPI